jgi:hypothetical protein
MGANFKRERRGESGFSLLFVRAPSAKLRKIDPMLIILCEMLRVAHAIQLAPKVKLRLR